MIFTKAFAKTLTNKKSITIFLNVMGNRIFNTILIHI